MKAILAEPQRELLARFAWSNVLVALDFDGTLAPIVPNPPDAQLREPTRRKLAQVALRYPLCVISGRAQRDLGGRLGGIGVRAVIGNHGLEPSPGNHRWQAAVARWLPALRRELRAHEGLEIEDKRYSLAIHYRKTRTRRVARLAIQRAVAGLGPGVRLMGGKLVLNVVPEGAPHKGAALVQLRQKFRADTAIYVGDDLTDEDVFALDDPGRLLCIRVGQARRSAAHYYIRNQREIDRLLARLIELRVSATDRRTEHAAR